MTTSNDLFEKAKLIFPGGVNSPVRAFQAVGRNPIFISHAKGAYLYDVEGKSYIDYINSWGPLVLGHSEPNVIQAITDQAQKGVTFGACHELEIKLAEIIQKYYPSLEMLRFCSSGTEAGMAVVRLARGFTGRNKIIKFSGNYHGHADSLLVSAGSGAATQGIPGSSGVLDILANQTIIVEYNDLDSVESCFNKFPNEIAAIIVEPVCGNAGFIKPAEGFLKGLKSLTEKFGSLLILDEVMTGFRVGLHGAQGLYGIKPDLTMLGKVIGGGLPVGAFGGRADIMKKIAPLGDIYQAGTLSGNPLAMAAGISTLNIWTSGSNFNLVAGRTRKLSDNINRLAKEYNLEVNADYLGSMFGFFFTKDIVTNYTEAKLSNLGLFTKFYNFCLDQGIYFAPSQFEAGFVSLAHSDQEIDQTIEVIKKSFEWLI